MLLWTQFVWMNPYALHNMHCIALHCTALHCIICNMHCTAHKICTSMVAPHLGGRESVIADFSQILTEENTQEFRNTSFVISPSFLCKF